MCLVKVTDALVSTTKHASLNGSGPLAAAQLDENYQSTVYAQVAVDTIGVSNRKIVTIITGSSACMSSNKDHSAIDAAAMDIVDSLEFSD